VAVTRLAQRILVLRALGLGDLLTAVPALRAVRDAFPDGRITLACPERLRPLVALTGSVDALLPTRELEPLAWQGRRPTLAVNLHGRGPQSHRLLLALRPRNLIAFASSDAGYDDGPERDGDAGDDEHEVRRWCRLLGASGIPANPHDLLLRPPGTPAPVEDAVVVHPGAAFPSRRWPVERYAAVARALSGAGAFVVITGSRRERPLAEQVAALAGLAGSRVLAGHTGLAELAALVASARLVVCGDTGIGHLATAFATPSVLLFGPVPPAAWGPLVEPARHRVLWRGGRGDPWGKQPDPALLRIRAEEVVAAARDLLGAYVTSPSLSTSAGRRVRLGR